MVGEPEYQAFPLKTNENETRFKACLSERLPENASAILRQKCT